jgi:ribosome biogenesis GTPase A
LKIQNSKFKIQNSETAVVENGNGHFKEEKKRFVIALAGNPNAGKTTLFNSLTGLRQKVANYPGVTVERKEGNWQLDEDKMARLIDLMP